MPRFDGNTSERRTRHHKQMKSGAKGKGHDAKRRRNKRDRSQRGKRWDD